MRNREICIYLHVQTFTSPYATFQHDPDTKDKRTTPPLPLATHPSTHQPIFKLSRPPAHPPPHPPEMGRRRLYLHAVSPDEEAVAKVKGEVSDLFSVNAQGPVTYVALYDRYTHLLDGTTLTEVQEFIDTCGILKVRRGKAGWVGCGGWQGGREEREEMKNERRMRGGK